MAGAVRCESESPKITLLCHRWYKAAFPHWEKVCVDAGKKEQFQCARGKVALMCGCAQVWAMPATARFPRAAFVVLMAEKGKKYIILTPQEHSEM